MIHGDSKQMKTTADNNSKQLHAAIKSTIKQVIQESFAAATQAPSAPVEPNSLRKVLKPGKMYVYYGHDDNALRVNNVIFTKSSNSDGSMSVTARYAEKDELRERNPKGTAVGVEFDADGVGVRLVTLLRRNTVFSFDASGTWGA